MTHRLVIVPALDRLGNPLSVHVSVMHEGRVVVEKTIEPLCDGARYLKSIGLRGRIEVYDQTRRFPRLIGSVEKAAALTVVENDKTGPAFRKWKPSPYAKAAAS